MAPDENGPRLEFVFEVRVDVEEGWHVGRGADERLWFTPITGGTVHGPRLDGVVLAGGGDWSVQRGGTTELDARYLLRADDGAVIGIHNRGYYRASAEVEARVAAGESVDESLYYFRTAPGSRQTPRSTAGWRRTSSWGSPATRRGRSGSASSWSSSRCGTRCSGCSRPPGRTMRRTGAS